MNCAKAMLQALILKFDVLHQSIHPSIYTTIYLYLIYFKVNCAKAMLQALILKFDVLMQQDDIDRNGEEFHAIKVK